MQRYGPKGISDLRFLDLLRSAPMPNTPPISVPMINATTVEYGPKRSPAAAINLISPPPIPWVMIATTRSGRLTISAPTIISSNDFLKSMISILASMMMSRWNRSLIIIVSMSIYETMIKIDTRIHAKIARIDGPK